MGRLDLAGVRNFFKSGKTGRRARCDEDEGQAFAVPNTNRHPWGDFSLLQSLTPERLAGILSDVRRGECLVEYIELAQDIELKDLHYRSVLSTRKDAITGLEIKVIPASEEARDVGLAEAVERDIVNNSNAKLYALIRDMLDALAKGFSVSEIIWDTSAAPWKPAAYRFRDPRWFRYDAETGKTLMLRAEQGCGLEPLKPFRFVARAAPDKRQPDSRRPCVPGALLLDAEKLQRYQLGGVR